jgi:hypothetical protein
MICLKHTFLNLHETAHNGHGRRPQSGLQGGRRRVLCALLVAVPFAMAATPPASVPSAPAPAAEQLHYVINWPSGLGLGEASLTFRSAPAKAGEPARVEGDLKIDASVPGFQVADHYQSTAGANFCSTSFDKVLSHGTRRADETLQFDQRHGTIVRESVAAAPIRVPVGTYRVGAAACAKDALTYLAYMRRELAQGRLPEQQTVYFGAPYQVNLNYRGEETVQVSGAAVSADRVDVQVHGPASDVGFTAFFARDAVRTPVLFRVPLQNGTFSMELQKQ